MADVQDKVPELRSAFLNKYDGSILDDTYDERDVEWVQSDDGFLRATLRSFKVSGDVKKATDLLNDILLFRAKYKVNDLTWDDMHPFYRDQNSAFFNGHDKQGNAIMQIKVGKAKRGHLVEESKRWIIYNINKHYRNNPEVPIAFFYDFVDAGPSNWDLEISKFFVKLTNTYFPNCFGCALMFKMGTALEALWTLLKVLLDAEQSKRTIFVKRSNVQQYVEPEFLLPHQIKEIKPQKEKKSKK